MTIRPARHDERETLIRLALHFAATPPYSQFLSQVTGESVGALIDVIFSLGDKAVIFVCEDEAGIYGGLALVEDVNLINGQPYASEAAWWVEPERRGALAGPQMLGYAEQWARGRGLGSIKMVAPTQSTVGRFYERLGYQALETAYVKAL